MSLHSDFVHLHVHTTYSLLDAAVDIKKLVAKAKEYNMPALAITDHGNMHGAIEFYKTASKAGIKPILGCEFYITPHDRHVKSKLDNEVNYWHLLCLAKDEEGYNNLIKLCSTAFIDGFYYKPRIDKQVLADHSKGLICSSACLAGEIPRAILNKNIPKAEKAIDEYLEIFGKDNFFLELMDHGLSEQKAVNEKLIELSLKKNVPLIATNDSHYVDQSDWEAHDAYLCIGTVKKMNDPNRRRFQGKEFYFKSPSEMRELFSKVPDALRNTVHIANRVSFDIDSKYKKNHMPAFKVPEGFNEYSYLVNLCTKGLEEKYDEITPQVKERFDYELNVIKDMGFTGYFLIVQDFINWARKNDISVGPGRGSAAGSIVAYTLGITNIDPLRYNLIFERFLNPGRNSMPDIDTDFEDERREDVINYVIDTYGKEKVSQIVTFGTLKAKAAIRDVCRVLDIPIKEADQIAKLVPDTLGIKLDQAYNDTPDLKNLINSNPLYKKMFEIAKRLEGLKRNLSIHAAGIIIGDAELSEYVPLCKVKESVATQFDKDIVEECGLLKMDFLGLKNLTVIKKCTKLIKEYQNKDIDPETIPLDDEDTYSLLKAGKTIGVFQLESEGMRELMMRLKPDNFEEIIALIALYRPGPLKSGMDTDFIKGKFHPDSVSYPHDDLKTVLDSTYGVFIYQEQVMKIAQVIGGFSMSKADELRKAMGKKKRDKMDALKAEFLDGAIKQQYDKKFADDLYDDMAKFAEYGFNKSHSAAYAVITYITAYLKTHYPTEYMCALLSVFKGKIDNITKYLKECKEMRIQILAPDINYSGIDFTVENDQIRFGLSAIQNVGGKAALSILENRTETEKYTTLFDLTDKIDLQQVNKKVLEALTKAGALDSIDGNRAAKFSTIEDAISTSSQIKQEKANGQMGLFGGGSSDSDETTLQDQRVIVNIPEWHESEILKNEKEVLGVYITGHPLIKYEDHVRALSTHNTEQLKYAPNEEHIKIAGLISEVRKRTAKASGKRYAIITLEDFDGTIEGFIFNRVFEDYELLIEKDNPVLIEGTIRDESNSDTKKNKLYIKHISSLENVKAPTLRKILHVVLTEEELKDDCLHSLRGIFVSHKGKSPIYIHVYDDNKHNKKIKVNDSLRVTISNDLMKRLREHSAVKDFWEENVVEEE